MFEKTVIIVGGGTGIGEAITQLFTNAGANVVIASKRNREQPESNIITFIETDIRDEGSVKKMVDATHRKFGKIDIVINSAGVNYKGQIDIPDFSLEEYRDIFDINMTGTFLVTKHTLSHLKKTKGSIINIASQLGLVPDLKFPVYCASKAAVVMFTKSMAARYAADGVRINCVCPGPTDTPFLRKNFPVGRLPMKRLGTPEEVANVVFFLASDKCSYVTGAAYSVDGGSSISRGYDQKPDTPK